MTTYYTFDDVLSALAQVTQYEASAKFAQGDVLALACDPPTLVRLGYASQNALLRDAAVAVGRGRRTLFKRLQVARTFAPSERNERLSWETHYVASTSADPAYWLARAADAEMTSDQLKAAMKAANEDPERGERVYLLRAAECIAVNNDGVRFVLENCSDYDLSDLRAGMRVIVTMAWEPVQEMHQIG